MAELADAADSKSAEGFDDEDVWDIAAITAFFGLSNRMASFSNMLPNPEFCDLEARIYLLIGATKF